MRDTLYIIDDHSIVRYGLKDWLEANTNWKVTNTFSNSKDCISHLSKTEKINYPEILIIDVQLVDEVGFSLCRKITEEFSSIKVVMYSMYDTPGYILQAKDNGAKGYISKVASEQELAKCLEIVQNGGTYIEEKMVAAQQKLEDVMTIFSKQERLIFEFLLQKKSNDQICNELFISSRTVENYVSRIYDKLDIKNRNELISKYGESKTSEK